MTYQFSHLQSSIHSFNLLLQLETNWPQPRKKPEFMNDLKTNYKSSSLSSQARIGKRKKRKKESYSHTMHNYKVPQPKISLRRCRKQQAAASKTEGDGGSAYYCLEVSQPVNQESIQQNNVVIVV